MIHCDTVIHCKCNCSALTNEGSDRLTWKAYWTFINMHYGPRTCTWSDKFEGTIFNKFPHTVHCRNRHVIDCRSDRSDPASREGCGTGHLIFDPLTRYVYVHIYRWVIEWGSLTIIHIVFLAWSQAISKVIYDFFVNGIHFQRCS